METVKVTVNVSQKRVVEIPPIPKNCRTDSSTSGSGDAPVSSMKSTLVDYHENPSMPTSRVHTKFATTYLVSSRRKVIITGVLLFAFILGFQIDPLPAPELAKCDLAQTILCTEIPSSTQQLRATLDPSIVSATTWKTTLLIDMFFLLIYAAHLIAAASLLRVDKRWIKPIVIMTISAAGLDVVENTGIYLALTSLDSISDGLFQTIRWTAMIKFLLLCGICGLLSRAGWRSPSPWWLRLLFAVTLLLAMMSPIAFWWRTMWNFVGLCVVLGCTSVWIFACVEKKLPASKDTPSPLYRLAKFFLFRMDAEAAHYFVTGWAKRLQTFYPQKVVSILSPSSAMESSPLSQSIWNLTFPNPVGLAGGFDKNADLVTILPALGFGFLEVGSITNKPSLGNTKPRAFRLPSDKALINRMGLNNAGAAQIAKRLAGYRSTVSPTVPLGINVAKTHDPTILGPLAIEDIVSAVRLVGNLGDYLVINVSCPNTKEGKTFEEPEALDNLLNHIQLARNDEKHAQPLLVKLAPQNKEKLSPIVKILKQHQIDGIVATNTSSPNAYSLQTGAAQLEDIGRGGLSGKPLQKSSNAMIRNLFQLTNGQIPIIGVGGIISPLDAYSKIRSGASLVQMYTGLVYQGPGLINRTNRALAWLLHKDGFTNISQAVGIDWNADSSP